MKYSVDNEKNELFIQIKELIILLRRRENIEANWSKFNDIMGKRLVEVCNSLNTRWLVSIADSYVDYGNEIEKRNAMYISIIANMEKLFATRLLMYDLKLNPGKLSKLKTSLVIPLWDGMTSFNIQNGNMTNNLFGRIRTLLKETPSLELLFETILKRISANETFLTDINLYNKRLFESPQKPSVYTRLLKKMKKLF